MLKGAVNVQTVNGHTGVNHLFKVSKCEFSHHPFDSFILSLAPFKNDKVSSLPLQTSCRLVGQSVGWLVGFLKGREVTIELHAPIGALVCYFTRITIHKL